MSPDKWGAFLAGFAALIGGLTALVQARRTAKAGVSGDEREARKDEATERRDTLADRDNLIAALERRVTSVETNHNNALARITELETHEDDIRTQLMIHASWDWQAIELARAGGVILPPPPPLMPPRTA